MNLEKGRDTHGGESMLSRLSPEPFLSSLEPDGNKGLNLQIQILKKRGYEKI